MNRVDRRHREDAEQEAWLAICDNRDPVKAVQTYAKREFRHEARIVCESDLGTNIDELDTDSAKIPEPT